MHHVHNNNRHCGKHKQNLQTTLHELCGLQCLALIGHLVLVYQISSLNTKFQTIANKEKNNHQDQRLPLMRETNCITKQPIKTQPSSYKIDCTTRSVADIIINHLHQKTQKRYLLSYQYLYYIYFLRFVEYCHFKIKKSRVVSTKRLALEVSYAIFGYKESPS